ncbi:hypothetical protein [Agromyces sp. LHK192]|uniref:hypothetical protein n=1 Tax=Agromyces sp. LHK192 TaxID=2498704 RepID=UPI000FD8D56B|nr:hypothetical protein [Agromyces sp. LHK192]
MLDASWWLPSLVVFGGAAVLAVLAVTGFRAAARRRERISLAAGRQGEIEAKTWIVRADEAIREGRREVAYAEAQFGRAAASPLADAVEQGARMLREALFLQQRLDDAEPDTAAERRTWSGRIIDGCRTAVGLVDDAAATLASAREAERDVPTELPDVRDRVAGLTDRLTRADASVAHLAERFAGSALAGAAADREAASTSLGDAEAALDDVRSAQARSGHSAAEMLGRARAAADDAERRIAAVERVESDLAAAVETARVEARRLDDELARARTDRDTASSGADAADPALAAATVALGVVLRDTAVLLAEPAPARTDPFLRRDRLRAARDRLEAARAEMQRSSSRLHGARSALGGALAIAESHLVVARGLIERGRGRVGADARTRLAEAERQLVIARQEPDPVAALDAARRAAARAADAEALARYDGAQG